MIRRIGHHVHTKLDEIKKQFNKRSKLRIRYFLYLAALISFLILTANIHETVKEGFFFKEHKESVLFWTKSPDVFIEAVQNNFFPKKVKATIYKIVPGMHYWRIMSTNQVGMDTFLGCNPFLKSLNAVVGEQVVSTDKSGALHYIMKDENLGILSRLYNIQKQEIKRFNRISIFHPLKKGRIIFIPKGKPRVFTPEFYPRYVARHQFVVPTNGWVASRGFGMLINPFTGKMSFHKGIDMKASAGTPIFAVMDGRVTFAGSASTYGKLVIIKHTNNMETYYAHCSRIFVKPGEEVKQRKCIALVGDTGWATVAHLHFEIRTNGKPIDPLRYLW